MTIGEEIYQFANRLFPYNRFLIGDGVRKTLDDIKIIIPMMEIHNIECGTKVFDWIIPDEWCIRDAYIEERNGKRIIDYKENNLHVMAYSNDIDAWLTKKELSKYIYTNQDYPDVIPYVTSYYREGIGMCMSQKMWDGLDDKELYHIKIDAEKKHGYLSYGDLVIKGQSQDEILFHSVICHPSLANDELSGPALATILAREVEKLKDRYYTYRFVFVPETIGAIAYISNNIDHLKKRVKAGFILSCEGDNGDYSYLPTIDGNTLADRAAKKVLSTLHPGFKEYSFMDRGSDERQYNAPGVDIPVCLVCRTLPGQFKEYHTSADNMSFVSAEGFSGSFGVLWSVVQLLENNRKYMLKVMCEPQLGRRGLYSNVSKVGSKLPFKNNIDFLAYADGNRDIIEISDITGIDYRNLIEIANTMNAEGIVSAEE